MPPRLHRGVPPGLDPLGRWLEWGLCALVILAPLPFGAVLPEGRLALEVAAFLLLALWLVRATRYPTALPSRACLIGLAGFLGLALLQAAPVGRTVVSFLSPSSVSFRDASVPTGEALAAEQRLLGVHPADLDPPAAVSLDPGATASATRTGAALAAIFLLATHVASTRGLKRLALALLIGAAIQGLYGTLVLASRHDMIWHVPKDHYLNSATGTFVNRNHYAGLLAASLPCGLGLVLAGLPVGSAPRGPRERLLRIFGSEGSRTLLVSLLFLLGLSGLLLSFSRAGTALGVLGVGLTVAAARRHRLRFQIVVVLVVLAIALIPLAQLGADRLASRYRQSVEDLFAPGGRAMVWVDTLRMTAAFPVLGIGFGAFDAAYPLYRSPAVRLHFEHAHNDLLQAAAEGGLVGLLLLAVFLAPVLVTIVAALRGRFGVLAAGFAAGLAALLLHALVDFHFHIPSNAALAAILAGALQGFVWNSRT